jgi:hypothetical protein
VHVSRDAAISTCSTTFIIIIITTIIIIIIIIIIICSVTFFQKCGKAGFDVWIKYVSY